MPIKYSVVPKRNPSDLTAPPKYYPVVRSSGRISQRGLANKGADMSALTVADMSSALEILLKLIPEELAEGNIVDLGDFGTFRVTVSAEGSDAAESVTASNVRKLSVRFTPGKEFKRALALVDYEKIA